MGNTAGLRNGVSIYFEKDELRLIRAALRIAQLHPDRPLTFQMDIDASRLVATISEALDKRL